MADELAAMPGEVGDIFAGEEDDPSFVRQGVREDEACAVGVDGGVGLERDGAFAVQLIIAGWKGDVSGFGEEVCEEVCIVCGGGEESGAETREERDSRRGRSAQSVEVLKGAVGLDGNGHGRRLASGFWRI